MHASRFSAWALSCMTIFVGCDENVGEDFLPIVDARVQRDASLRGDVFVLDMELGDECSPGATRECGINQGSCRAGVERCVAGLWAGECEGETPPAAESCDEVDNDCDGTVDEDYRLGAHCKYRDERNFTRNGLVDCNFETGLAFCRPDRSCDADADGDGYDVCADCDDTDPFNFPGNEERCDGADNDCDVSIDESFGLDAECNVGRGFCLRAGRTVCSLNGLGLVCDGDPGPPDVETCDDEDDDCDGFVDEDFNLGSPCSVGVGACLREGVNACGADGQAICFGEPGMPIEEVCNDLDDDCDGRSDEGLNLGDACTVGEGICQREGRRVCGVENEVLCTAEPGPPDVERCNGSDDDCDGEIDEGNPDGGDNCETGERGICLAGAINCIEGILVCARLEEPREEACNDLDDDCDGFLDEAPGVGQPCFGGVGACAREGRLVCGAEGGVVCDAIPGASSDERCNAIDDDCDGEVDEENPGGGAACESDLLGVCNAGILVCDVGVFICRPQIEPEVETCNHFDDDCDGVIDEAEGTGTPCAVGIGACRRAGRRLCGPDGGLVCSALAGAPAAERCNGLDEDCDGLADEGNPGGGIACDTGEFGICAAGVVNCREAQPVCERAADPVAEVCNGLDDDCDQVVDEAEGVGDECTAGVGACLRDGRRICGPDGDVICSALPGAPFVERCNEIDDDCDGDTDEGFELGAECVVGVGACEGPGTTICAENGLDLACDGQAGQPEAEVCNGEDDDCDGRVDEENPEGGGPCDTDRDGTCAAGNLTCTDGELVCTQSVFPRREVCDEADDDCDGRVDELYGTGEACERGVGACLRAGEVVCAADQASVECSAAPGRPIEERCNEADDDCDGTTDEGFEVAEVCFEGLGICRAPGQYVCAADGSAACNAEVGEAAEEVCNLTDDDCDGGLDEGNPGGGANCDTGRDGVCGPGVQTCEFGEVVCVSVVEVSEEVCNGVDDDCDGETDEDDPGLNTACVTGNLGECSSGLTRCEDAELVCEQQTQVADETCDELDNDCDGDADENFPGVFGPCDDVDADLCARGELRCDAVTGGTVCVGDTASEEICNFIDDDCDGVIDNGIDVLTDITNCGGCGVVCPAPGPECVDGACYRTYWVDTAGDDINGTGAENNPWRTLTHAVREVPPMDAIAGVPRARIYARPGRYSADPALGDAAESFPLRLRDTIQLVGFGQATDVIIDGGTLQNPAARPGGGELIAVVDMPDENNLLANVTLRNGGQNPRFSTIFVSASQDLILQDLRTNFNVADVIIEGASANNAYPVLIAHDARVKLERVTVRNNVGRGARSLILSTASEMVVENCWFNNNDVGLQSAYGIIRASAGELRVSNSVFVDNEGNSIQFDDGATGRVTNCTFVDNEGSGPTIVTDADADIVNNVFAFNTTWAILVSRHAAGSLVRNNLFWQNSGVYSDLNNVRVLTTDALNNRNNAQQNNTGDPVFLDRAGLDFHLGPGSACVDQAHGAYAPEVDYDYVARPRGARPDIGAFESRVDP